MRKRKAVIFTRLTICIFFTQVLDLPVSLLRRSAYNLYLFYASTREMCVKKHRLDESVCYLRNAIGCLTYLNKSLNQNAYFLNTHLNIRLNFYAELVLSCLIFEPVFIYLMIIFELL